VLQLEKNIGVKNFGFVFATESQKLESKAKYEDGSKDIDGDTAYYP